MRYYKSRVEETTYEDSFRVYVTDHLYYHNRNKMFNDRWWDIVSGNVLPEDTRSGDEVAFDTIVKLGLKVKHEPVQS